MDTLAQGWNQTVVHLYPARKGFKGSQNHPPKKHIMLMNLKTNDYSELELTHQFNITIHN